MDAKFIGEMHKKWIEMGDAEWLPITDPSILQRLDDVAVIEPECRVLMVRNLSDKLAEINGKWEPRD